MKKYTANIAQKLKRKKSGFALLLLFAAVLLTACKKEKTEENDGELNVKSEIVSSKEAVIGSGVLSKKEIELAAQVYSFTAEDISVSSGTLKIYISEASKASIIEADDNVLEDFSLEVDENSKTITLKADSKKTYKNLNCTVTVCAAVDSITAGGVSDISYTASREGNIRITAKQAARVEAAGTCTRAEYDISGAAVLNAFELKAEQVQVRAEGSSKANVYAEASIKIEALKASTVNYSGNPKTVEDYADSTASIQKK